MIVLDTNYILRFLMRDDEAMYQIARDTIRNHQCLIDNEVFAEVIFVLIKVYHIPREEIRRTLERFLSLNTILVEDKALLMRALQLFDEKNIDIVDAILCAKSRRFEVRTFDKKLGRCIVSVQAP